jgi:hypothetical protein
MARGRCFGQQAVDQRAVADVALHEDVARIALQAGQVGAVAGVGERVEVDDRLVRCRQPVEHEVAADEAGAAGDENGHGCSGGCPSVGVLEAHDVVLAQVAARLHLDDLQRHLARVGQAVHLWPSGM